MDLATLVATAVAAGASPGLTDTAKHTLADAYTAFEALLTSRCRAID